MSCKPTRARISTQVEPVITPEAAARFWSKVAFRGPGGCWLWQASVNATGYGSFGICGAVFRSHRIAYLLDMGVWPGTLCVCHHCDTPRCCNASHLFLGTLTDNARDREAKGRGRGAAPRGEANGSAKLTETAVREIRSRYALGGVTHDRLGKEYGIAGSVIGKVISRDIWTHVADEESRGILTGEEYP